MASRMTKGRLTIQALNFSTAVIDGNEETAIISRKLKRDASAAPETPVLKRPRRGIQEPAVSTFDCGSESSLTQIPGSDDQSSAGSANELKTNPDLDDSDELGLKPSSPEPHLPVTPVLTGPFLMFEDNWAASDVIEKITNINNQTYQMTHSVLDAFVSKVAHASDKKVIGHQRKLALLGIRNDLLEISYHLLISWSSNVQEHALLERVYQSMRLDESQMAIGKWRSLLVKHMPMNAQNDGRVTAFAENCTNKIVGRLAMAHGGPISDSWQEQIKQIAHRGIESLERQTSELRDIILRGITTSEYKPLLSPSKKVYKPAKGRTLFHLALGLVKCRKQDSSEKWVDHVLIEAKTCVAVTNSSLSRSPAAVRPSGKRRLRSQRSKS